MILLLMLALTACSLAIIMGCMLVVMISMDTWDWKVGILQFIMLAGIFAVFGTPAYFALHRIMEYHR